MRKIYYLLLLFVGLQACTPDDIVTTESAGSKQELLSGTWQLASFKQLEMSAVEKDFPLFAREQDLTNIFPGHPYSDFRVTFNADGTFTAETGESFVVMLTDGTWSLDNEAFPTKIIFTQGDQTQEMLVGSWGSMIFGKFMFAEQRIDPATGKTIIRYEYNFNKTK